MKMSMAFTNRCHIRRSAQHKVEMDSTMRILKLEFLQDVIG